MRTGAGASPGTAQAGSEGREWSRGLAGNGGNSLSSPDVGAAPAPSHAACGTWGRAGHILTMPALSLQVKENNYRGHGDSVDQLCWHPSNPDLFVTASGDKTIRIWDVRTTKCIATVNTKGESLPSQVSPGRTQLCGIHLQWHRALGLSCGYF